MSVITDRGAGSAARPATGCRIVVPEADGNLRALARRAGATLVVSDAWDVQGPTLFARGVIPWRLVPHGFRLIERWDAAAPLWRYGVLAQDIGTAGDRARTEAVTLDLRVLLLAPELLFVRDNEVGRALVDTWRRECAGADERLAFLRALHMVKPRFCALPQTWLSGPRSYVRPRRRRPHVDPPADLVRVEVTPGRFVRCRPEEAEAVQARYQAARARMERRGRRGSGNG